MIYGQIPIKTTKTDSRKHSLENLNTSTTSKEVESVTKNLPTK